VAAAGRAGRGRGFEQVEAAGRAGRGGHRESRSRPQGEQVEAAAGRAGRGGRAGHRRGEQVEAAAPATGGQREQRPRTGVGEQAQGGAYKLAAATHGGVAASHGGAAVGDGSLAAWHGVGRRRLGSVGDGLREKAGSLFFPFFLDEVKGIFGILHKTDNLSKC
jgi:hypothetical protein